jgi:hypothetical protein
VDYSGWGVGVGVAVGTTLVSCWEKLFIATWLLVALEQQFVYFSPPAQRGRSKSCTTIPAGVIPKGGETVIKTPSDFSTLGVAIENHLRNQFRRATFSNINDGNDGNPPR